MIYSKKIWIPYTKDREDHQENTGKFSKAKAPPKVQDSFQTSQPSSIGFVPKAALLDAPENITNAVLPKILYPIQHFPAFPNLP